MRHIVSLLMETKLVHYHVWLAYFQHVATTSNL